MKHPRLPLAALLRLAGAPRVMPRLAPAIAAPVLTQLVLLTSVPLEHYAAPSPGKDAEMEVEARAMRDAQQQQQQQQQEQQKNDDEGTAYEYTLDESPELDDIEIAREDVPRSLSGAEVEGDYAGPAVASFGKAAALFSEIPTEQNPAAMPELDLRGYGSLTNGDLEHADGQAPAAKQTHEEPMQQHEDSRQTAPHQYEPNAVPDDQVTPEDINQDGTFLHPDGFSDGIFGLARRALALSRASPLVHQRRTMVTLERTAAATAPQSQEHQAHLQGHATHVEIKDLSPLTRGTLNAQVKRDVTTTFVAPNAVVMGDVTLGRLSSVFYSAVLRADTAPILIGDRTCIGDACVVQSGAQLGSNVTVAPRSVVCANARVGDNVSLGCGSIVGVNASVGNNCIVPTGAVVPDNAHIEPGTYFAEGKKMMRDDEAVSRADVERIAQLAHMNERVSRDHKVLWMQRGARRPGNAMGLGLYSEGSTLA